MVGTCKTYESWPAGRIIVKWFWISLGIAFLITLLVFGTLRGGSKHKNLAEDAFEGRTPLEPKDFHKTHFESKGIPLEFVEKFLTNFSDEYGIDFSRLSAEDDFRNSLAFLDDVDSLGLVEFKMRLEEEFEIEISDEEAPEMFTSIDNLITSVWQKTQSTE